MGPAGRPRPRARPVPVIGASMAHRIRTTLRRRNANCLNALSSTGAKTAAGRASSARNARRHGLSVPVLSDPALSAEIEAMARRIVGDVHASPRGDLLDTLDTLLGLARRIAQAQIDLMRVRRARHDLVSSRFADPGYRTSKGLMTAIALLGEAGEMRARGEPIPPAMAHDMLHRPQGAAKYAVILAELGAQLAAMDRYERRALSRRKFAIRAFDAACAATSAAAALRDFGRTNPLQAKPC